MEWENSFLICDEGIHHIVYDIARAETVCSKCGLVLNEAPVEFDADLAPLSKRLVTYRTIETSRLSQKPPGLRRNLIDALSAINPPKPIRDTSLEICKAINGKGVTKGYTVSTAAKAVVYTACRLRRSPTFMSELTRTTAEERKRIIRCSNRIRRKLELKAPPIETADCLLHLATKKKILEDIVTLADSILKRAKENHLIKGAKPIGTAAAALYTASILRGQKTSQKEWAEAAGVSEVTIRANCRVLKKIVSRT